jgi:alpha-beta hydrolase superfamily lysophospholipase
VVLAHGYGEHIGRYDEFARYLVARGHPTYGFDMRGHGKSSGQRGHVAPYRRFADDLDAYFRAVERLHPGRPCVLLGHSHGGLTALLSVEHGNIRPAALVLICPMVELRPRHRPVPELLASLLARVAPSLALSNGLDVAELTHDTALARAWGESPLNHGRTSLGWYAGALAAMREAMLGLSKVTLPTLVLAGELDPIVDTRAVERMAAALPHAELHVVAGSLHEPLNELDRAQTFARIGDWLAQLS